MHKQLSENQKWRQENRNRIVKPKPSGIISEKELERRERERQWKENKEKADESLHQISKKQEKKQEKKQKEYKLENINKQYIWDFFCEITKSGSRNNESRARFRQSVDNDHAKAIREKIQDDRVMLKYFNNQSSRRDESGTNKNLEPIKQPM